MGNLIFKDTMIVSILDCYTDEPSGLGVPPFLGTYPRYVAGAILKHNHQCYYLRIDDLREPSRNKNKTDVLTVNRTRNASNAKRILKASKLIIVIAGIQTPGRYLSAIPGSPKEAARLLEPYDAKKVLVGPAAGLGSTQIGGRLARAFKNLFDLAIGGEPAAVIDALLTDKPAPGFVGYKRLQGFIERGASIVEQIEPPFIAELETGRGCPRTIGCSFCTEPLKHKLEWREQGGILREAKALYREGVSYFRLGKQSDFFSYKRGSRQEIEALLKPLAALKPKCLHIDNVDPVRVIKREGVIKEIVKYCTPGNVAAFGVESFDQAVIKANNLGATPKMVIKAIQAINRIGRTRGDNGMPRLLPGINLLLGLIGERRSTLKTNLKYLKEILSMGLLLRRINIRQVDIFPGTSLHEHGGLRFLKRNKRHYYGFRRRVREEIDHPMLQALVPVGTVLNDVFMEIHDGNHSFGRQLGTYPLIVGVNEKLQLRRFYNIKVTGHMLRSVTGVVV